MSGPINAEIILHDVAYHFAHLLGFPHDVRFYNNGIIQTSIGCYRLAFEPPTIPGGHPHIALFYGRHPDDLAEDPSAAPDACNILHKERAVLVEMQNLLHTINPDTPLNVSRIIKALARTEHDLAVANLEETCVHFVGDCQESLGEGFGISQYFSYRFVPSDDARAVSVEIAACHNGNGNVLMPLEPIKDAVREAGTEVTAPRWHQIKVRINLDDPQDGNIRAVNGEISKFSPMLALDVLLKDLGLRVTRMWLGKVPISVSEDPLDLLLSAADKAKNVAGSVRELVTNPEELARRLASFVASAVLESPSAALFEMFRDAVTSTATDGIVDLVSELGSRHKTGRVPEERLDLVAPHFSRFWKAQSGVHDCVMRCDDEKFGQLRWITDPQKFSFIPNGNNPRQKNANKIVAPDPADIFKYWVATYLKNPRETIINYFGQHNNIHDMLVDDSTTVLAKVSNGIHFAYKQDEGFLYAWYNAPLILPSLRRLARDADVFLKEGQVMVIDTQDMSKPTAYLPWGEFKEYLGSKTTVPQRIIHSLSPPQSPKKNDVMLPSDLVPVAERNDLENEEEPPKTIGL